MLDGTTRKSKGQKRLLIFLSIAACTILILTLNVSTSPPIKIAQFTDEVLVKINFRNPPGAYVKIAHPTPSNESYCKFNYGLPNQFHFTKAALSGTPELGTNGTHLVLYDVIEGTIKDDDPGGVTYATHVTKDFVTYIAEIARYWEGPISVAAYLPDGDPQEIVQRFVQLCYCVPDMSRVSLHFIFRNDDDLIQENSTINSTPNSSSCDLIDSFGDDNFNNIEKNHSNSWYPINVCRNAARFAAKTKFVLVSDVELMPSQGLATGFMKMLKTLECKQDEDCTKRVYVVPIFEVEASEAVPRTKAELVRLVKMGKACYFHRFLCGHCQKFPGLEQWKESDPGGVVKPLLIAKREAPYHRWEPIYIGTNKEPLYNEKLSWEGFQDKMLQMLEMCLSGYKLVILDGAFLVHWPGIKKNKASGSEAWRRPFKHINQMEYSALLKNLLAKYPPNRRCKAI